MFRTSTLCQRPTKERQGLCTRDVEANPSWCCILFSFPFHLKPSSLGTSPLSLHCRPPSLYSPQGTSPLAAWGEERGRRGDRSSSEGRSLPSHRHLIQSRHHWPSNAKGAGEWSWIDRQTSPASLKRKKNYCHSVHVRINFSNVHPIWVDSWSFIAHIQFYICVVDVRVKGAIYDIQQHLLIVCRTHSYQ